jgi:hypothetical protein
LSSKLTFIYFAPGQVFRRRFAVLRRLSNVARHAAPLHFYYFPSLDLTFTAAGQLSPVSEAVTRFVDQVLLLASRAAVYVKTFLPFLPKRPGGCRRIRSALPWYFCIRAVHTICLRKYFQHLRFSQEGRALKEPGVRDEHGKTA